jgi:hypothetical protein
MATADLPAEPGRRSVTVWCGLRGSADVRGSGTGLFAVPAAALVFFAIRRVRVLA